MIIRNLAFIALLSILLSCGREDRLVMASDFYAKKTDTKEKADNIAVEENCDTVSLKFKLDKHSVCLKLNDAEMKEVELSEAKMKLLQKWWDSLPEPLQAQIKSQEVEIELVSNVQSNGKSELTQEITDSRIEKTGAALEKIIGESADMTFTVKTRKENNLISASASTDIIPYVKISTKLSQFSSNFGVDKKGISTQNVHSLQFWWVNLPDDLKTMIQNGEVAVELNCIALDKGIEFRKGNRLGDKSDEYLYLMNQYLQNIIGFKTVNNKRFPLGIIKTNSQIEKVIENVPSDYLIRINLKNQKANSVKPSAL